jgi:hypothetical protein
MFEIVLNRCRSPFVYFEYFLIIRKQCLWEGVVLNQFEISACARGSFLRSFGIVLIRGDLLSRGDLFFDKETKRTRRPPSPRQTKFGLVVCVRGYLFSLTTKKGRTDLHHHDKQVSSLSGGGKIAK